MGHKFNGQQESDLTSCLQKVDRLDLRYCKVSDAGLKSMKDTVCITFVVHCWNEGVAHFSTVKKAVSINDVIFSCVSDAFTLNLKII